MTAEHPTTDKTTVQLDVPENDARHQPDRTSDAEQRELWRRYLEQQARLSCPGCGDDGLPSI
jgi:hypothetical protein